MAKTGTSKPKQEKKEETIEEFTNRMNGLKKQGVRHTGLKRRGGHGQSRAKG